MTSHLDIKTCYEVVIIKTMVWLRRPSEKNKDSRNRLHTYNRSNQWEKNYSINRDGGQLDNLLKKELQEDSKCYT